MNTTKMIKSFAVATLLASGSVFAAPVELLTNGSFESSPQGANSWDIYYTGNSMINGWSADAAGIELRNNVVGSAPNGSTFVELDTYTNSSMWQTINTVAGQTYSLSFQYQNRPGVDAASQGLSVTWNGASVVNVPDSTDWSTVHYTLIGNGSAMTLKFAATGTADGLGTSVDNISLTAAVPEPETYAMMLGGLALVGAIARRRKAAK